MHQISFNFTQFFEKVKPAFNHHGGYPPRLFWLKKGFDFANNNGDFNDAKATSKLGVGRSQVNAIRYWCHAFKILENDQPTELGVKLLSNNGYDPYLENPNSLWLLHWNLLKATCTAPTWYYTFTKFNKPQFCLEDLTVELGKYRDKIAPSIADSSLERDVSCLIRMYVENKNKPEIREDYCLFNSLRLIKSADNGNLFLFNFGTKYNLADEIIAVCCLEYAHLQGTARTIALSTLLYGEGSLGMVFKLTLQSLADALENVTLTNNNLAFSEQAGLLQFSFDGEPQEIANKLLANYYQSKK